MLKTTFRGLSFLVGGHSLLELIFIALCLLSNVLQSAATASDATLTTDVVNKAVAQARENDTTLLGDVKHAILKRHAKVPRELLPLFASLLHDKDTEIQRLGLAGIGHFEASCSQTHLVEYIKRINPRKLEAERGTDPRYEPEYSRTMMNAAMAVLLLGELADESAVPFLESLDGIRDLKLEWTEDVARRAVAKVKNRLDQRERSRRLLDDVIRRLESLRKAQALQGYRSDSLTVQWAILRYRDQPEEALAAARTIKEPFCASLALGGISVLRLTNDPEEAKDLLLEAQERALEIDHWTGSDATSLAYLFEVIPLFDSTRAKSLLAASRKNLQRWTDDEHRKSRAMAALSRATIAVDPSGVDDLLQEVSTSPQSNHYTESVQLLGRFVARTRKEWAAGEADRFYQTGGRWPFGSEPLNAVLLEDSLADLPNARGRINGLPDKQQDQARLALAQALQEAGKTDEALALLDEVDARTRAKVTQASWVRDLARKFRTLWTAEKVRVVTAEEVERFLRQPELSALKAMVNPTRPIVFRDGEQAAAFVAAASSLVRRMEEEFGFPHHGSPRSVLLGMLARIRAMQQDLERAEEIAGEITIPQLQAFYLMEACEASLPLPGVLRGWPIYFYTRTEIQIGTLNVNGDVVAVNGHESFGDYIEFLDRNSGETVGHRTYNMRFTRKEHGANNFNLRSNEAAPWPGSDSTLDALAPFTDTVLACTAMEKAEIVKRLSSHESTAIDLGGGEVIEGGGTVTYAYCRQRFGSVEVLHGNANNEDRVLQYGYVEQSDAFPGPRSETRIPFRAKAILLIVKEGRIMKALPDTAQNRRAVRSALFRYAEREKVRKSTLPRPR